jgi:hypothetical protein
MSVQPRWCGFLFVLWTISLVLYGVYGQIESTSTAAAAPEPENPPDSNQEPDPGDCSDDCGFAASGTKLVWQELPPASVTPLGTVFIFVNTVEDTTRFSTSTNQIPTFPPTNADGTRVATVTYINGGDITSTVV